MLYATLELMNLGIIMVGFTQDLFFFLTYWLCINFTDACVDENVSIVDLLYLFPNYTWSLHQHDFLFCDSRKRILRNVTLFHYFMIF